MINLIIYQFTILKYLSSTANRFLHILIVICFYFPQLISSWPWKKKPGRKEKKEEKIIGLEWEKLSFDKILDDFFTIIWNRIYCILGWLSPYDRLSKFTTFTPTNENENIYWIKLSLHWQEISTIFWPRKLFARIILSNFF